MSPPRKCLPHSVKLKLLADQEKGFGPTILTKKYKIKKSTYYRILSEKEAIRNFSVKDEVTHKIKPEDDDEAQADMIGNGEDGDETHESKPDESRNEMQCDTPQSLDGVNEAVMQWYTQQEADGIPVESGDIDEAAERLAQKLGFTHFKLNSSGWPLRFRKPQDIAKTPETEEEDDEESPALKPKKFLRIQDQITAFQRLQAGESAVKIGRDLGVSKSTILRIKKKLKDTLFTSLDQFNVQRLKTKKKALNATKVKVRQSEKPTDDDMSDAAQISDGNKESVWAAIERRKRLKFSKNGLSRQDRSLSYNEKLEAIAQYKSGSTIKQIANNFGVSTSTIQRVKKKFSASHKLAYKNYMKLEQKVNVLERLDEGETTMEIAEDLGVHEATIRAIRKSRLKIMNVYKASLASIGLKSSSQTKSTIIDKIEKRLLAWINDLKRRKMPLSNAMIRKKALMIQMKEGSSSTQTFIHSRDWLENFKKRHNIQQMLHEESESGSETDNLRFCKAGPKSKKKYYTVPLKVEDQSSDSQQTSLPTKDGMPLSKLAEGLREMYLSRNLPTDPYRCNAFTPRVILIRMEEETIKSKSEPQSDEETWLTAHTNTCSDSDWEDNTWDTYSQADGYHSNDDSKKKRKITTDDNNHKRRRLSDGENSDDKSVVDYSRSNFVSVPIKQEPLDSLDSVHPSVPMAVLPAGSSYVPPLPMFQMPTTGLTVFMPESQQMMMQHPANYPHANSSDIYLNQQQLRGRTVTDSPSSQFNSIHGEASIEPNIRPDNEAMIVMPFERNISEQKNSRHLPLSRPDSVVSDSLEEKTRRDRVAAIAENIEIPDEGSSHIKLRDLTFKLLELNNKNLICDERIERAREEYENTVAHIEAEKKINDKEIDKVLASIQEWKEAKSQYNT